jgi:hypothetical protein
MSYFGLASLIANENNLLVVSQIAGASNRLTPDANGRLAEGATHDRNLGQKTGNRTRLPGKIYKSCAQLK